MPEVCPRRGNTRPNELTHCPDVEETLLISNVDLYNVISFSHYKLGFSRVYSDRKMPMIVEKTKI
jgi:hypothetical protein